VNAISQRRKVMIHRMLLAAALFVVPGVTWAADEASQDFSLTDELEERRPQRCEDIYNAYRCTNTYGCEWDRYYGCTRDRNGGGRRIFECIASDNGWEEHRGGHRGRGRSQNAAAWNAIRNCEQYHGTCSVDRCEYYRI
jgi:hypothetical protein